jgi:glycosyltransferase involved in cell wall biosynthesis
MSKRRIRILHIITGLSTGGAEMMMLKLTTNMDNSKFENHVVSLTNKGPVGHRLSDAGIAVTCLNMPRGIPHPTGLYRLWSVIRREKPDIVQTWLYHADLLGLLAARLAGIKNVIWNLRCSYMGDEYDRGMTGFVIKLLARLSRLPAAIVINSKTGLKLHELRGYRPAHWVLLPNGFDPDQYRPDRKARATIRAELGIGDNTPLIGLVARLDPVKGYEDFLKAASKLAAKNPDVHFLLAGNGFVKDNGEIAEILADVSDKQFHLLGERKDIPAIMAALDIATCSSIGEGFPNVVGEAMSSGTICVATDVGDCRYILNDTRSIVPPSDPDKLAEAWQNILSMPASEREKISTAGRQRVIDNFSLSVIVTKYQNLYTELC